MKNNWNMFRFSEKQVALIVSRSSEFAGIVAMVSHFLFTILKGVLTNPTLAAFSKFEFSSSDKIISFTSDDQTGPLHLGASLQRFQPRFHLLFILYTRQVVTFSHHKQCKSRIRTVHAFGKLS